MLGSDFNLSNFHSFIKYRFISCYLIIYFTHFIFFEILRFHSWFLQLRCLLRLHRFRLYLSYRSNKIDFFFFKHFKNFEFLAALLNYHARHSIFSFLDLSQLVDSYHYESFIYEEQKREPWIMIKYLGMILGCQVFY